MRPDLTKIRNIIFDLGNVLLNLDFNASVKAFHKLASNRDVVIDNMIYSDPIFYQLGTGQISAKEFREGLRKLLQNKTTTDRQLDLAWNAMILDIPAKRVEMLQRLSKDYKLYLFSNTNQIHIKKLNSEFLQQHKIEFSSLFIKIFYSHEIHVYKPDINSYLKVIELAGIDTEETLFIDDLEENIEEAKKAGLKTLWLKHGQEIADVLHLVI